MHLKVVIPAFRRPKSLNRLLESLLKANSNSQNFSVLVSLDGGYASETLEVAKYYKGKFPEEVFEFYIHKENIGLRNHILWCGNLSNEFGSIIVLEDDLLIDEYFYEYATGAIKFYENESNIAGISLYSQQFNEFENLPFHPTDTDGNGNYFMQIPCSWGQIWTQSQWNEFYRWYKDNQDIDLNSIVQMPLPARHWPISSWKKYFYAYLILSNKYIVYPFRSYTSNCSDQGGFHNKSGINFLQVPLLNRYITSSELKFADFSKSNVKYDSFFELQFVKIPHESMEHESSITLDIYASKPLEYLKQFKYALTTRNVINPIHQYPLIFKPIESNLRYQVEDFKIGMSLTKSDNVLSSNIFDNLRIKFTLAQYYCSFDLSQNSIILYIFRVKIRRLALRIINYLLRR